MDHSLHNSTYNIGVLGLGYVGLPLAMAFGQKFPVTGYDIDKERVEELNSHYDRTNEVAPETFIKLKGVRFTSDELALNQCNVYIITVPTPLDGEKNPDLSFLISASRTVAKYLQPGNIVIYESTVYPGCTEEDCVPVLEEVSGLVYNRDFFCGYSPERINPGDKVNTLASIKKITSGSTPETADTVDALYARIITAGTYKAPSIRVAEAAKAIENAQRDVNISFMNELALIFDRMGIDTSEVLEAATTKWNFLPFKPGLVGGHCIGVDPHYLAYKATQLGYEPQVILSGRKVNEQMGVFVAEKLITLLKAKYGEINGLVVSVLGFAFKENCADTRNSKVADIYRTLIAAGIQVSVFDPLVNKESVKTEFGITMADQAEMEAAAIIVAVAHDFFQSIDFSIPLRQGIPVFDTKSMLKKQAGILRL